MSILSQDIAPRGPGASGGDGPWLDLGRPVRLGLAAFVLLVVVLGGWAAFTVIGGAVVSQGQIVVEGRSKMVQHPDGGTIAAIAVANGDRVEAGQVLIALDPSLVTLELDIARSRLAAALALRARLASRQAGLDAIDFSVTRPLPEALLARPLDLEAEQAAQTAIFEARTDMLLGGRALLAETQTQIDEQVIGLRAQITAIDEQLALLDDDIATQEDLLNQGLSRASQLSDLRRNRAELVGRRGMLEAETARLATQRRDAEMETLQSERTFQEDVTSRLGETESRIEELLLEIVTRQSELDRMVVRAPAAGVVHELQATTVGGVVAPGDTLMQIVPSDTGLAFEIRVDPAAIDQVYPGQEAEIILAAFDRQSTPHLQGEVHTVSAAAIVEPQTGQSFYRVELSVPPEELARLGDHELVPGMPIETYLATSQRSVLSYLVQPIATHMRRAFRE